MCLPQTESVPFLFHFGTGTKASLQVDWTDCHWFFLHRGRIGLIFGVHNRTNETTTPNWSHFCFVQYLMQRSYSMRSLIDICETRRIQHATYPLSIADGVIKRNKSGINLVGLDERLFISPDISPNWFGVKVLTWLSKKRELALNPPWKPLAVGR